MELEVVCGTLWSSKATGLALTILGKFTEMYWVLTNFSSPDTAFISELSNLFWVFWIFFLQ